MSVLENLSTNKKDLSQKKPSAEEMYVQLGFVQALAIETNDLQLYAATVKHQKQLGLNENIELDDGITKDDDGAFGRLLSAEILLTYGKATHKTKKALKNQFSKNTL